MSFICYNNANVVKLLIFVFGFIIFNQYIIAQEDPISEKLIEKEQEEEYIGINLRESEYHELQRIQTKYKLTDEETSIKGKYRSGQKLTLMEKYKNARANRKDYMRNKKLEKFRKKAVLNRQPAGARNRMKKNEKKANNRYKKTKRKKKRRIFFNLFK